MRARLTTAWRLALTSLLVTLVGMLLLAVVLLLLVGRYEAQRRSAELLASAQVEAAYLSELAALSNLQSAAAALVERYASVSPADQVVRVFGMGGELLASSASEIGYFPSPAAAELIRSPVPPLANVTRWRYAAQPISVGGQIVGVLEAAQPLAEERRLLVLIAHILARATLLALLVAVAGSIVLGRHMGQRLERLRRVAETIAAGDLAPRAPEQGAYELVQLARSLNRMADQLQTRLRQITTSAERERRFYRELAHELRTPLTALQGYLEQVEDTASAEQRGAIAAMQGEVRRLARLADRLSRPAPELQTALLRTAVDLPALAHELCQTLAGRAERAGIRLELQVEGAPPPAAADRDRVKQALLNLLDNALRHTPPGGLVQLSIRPAATAGAGVELLVSDTGPGVPEQLRPTIWEHGVRGPDGGSGIGLAVVREVARDHGGEVELLDSGPGARFRLRLPAPS